MAQQDIELILMRQLSSYLAMPIFIVAPNGDVLFYNEPAEAILGIRFEETGKVNTDRFYALFRPTKEDGTPFRQEEFPLYVARCLKKPAHSRFRILGMDGVQRSAEGVAFPLVGQSGHHLGAVGIFWESKVE